MGAVLGLQAFSGPEDPAEVADILAEDDDVVISITAAMPIMYDPKQFWGIALARRGSGIPNVLMRATVMLPFAAGIALLDHLHLLPENLEFAVMTTPFTVMPSLANCRASENVSPTTAALLLLYAVPAVSPPDFHAHELMLTIRPHRLRCM